MDFDQALSDILETSKGMGLSLSDFQKVQSLVYQAYYLGSLQSCIETEKKIKDAMDYITIDANSFSKQLAYHQNAEKNPIF